MINGPSTPNIVKTFAKFRRQPYYPSSGHTICSLSPALLIFPLQCIKLQARPVISNPAEKLARYSRKDERRRFSMFAMADGDLQCLDSLGQDQETSGGE